MRTDWLDEGRSASRRLNRSVRLTVPSVLAEGELFDLRITVFGADGLPEDAGVAIEVEPSREIAGLPRRIVITPQEHGMASVPGLRALDCRTLSIRGRIEGDEVASNVAWVFRDPPYRIYWGDLHVHSRLSNCHAWACRSPDFAYGYARDAAHLDFAAIADHTRGIAAEPGRWASLQAACREHDDAGRFATLLAFESSHAQGYGGDNNVYYRGAEGGFFWLDREDMKGNKPEVPLEEMWRWLDGQGRPYMTAPHHTGRRGKYRTFTDPTYDPERERFFEIYSAWGSSEMRWSAYPVSGGNNDGQGYFVDALRRGCRYGVVASSDDHTTMPGGESRSWRMPLGVTPANGYHHKGLAAVLCPTLARESVWDALHARACYGTTFARIPLELTIGELAMGQSLALSPSCSLRSRRPILLRWGSALPAETTITIVRNGEQWRQEVVRRRDAREGPEEIAVVDEEPIERVALRDAPFHPGPFVSYYARIESSGAQTAWTSPIWLDL